MVKGSGIVTAVALVQSLNRELSHAASVAKKKKKSYIEKNSKMYAYRLGSKINIYEPTT